MEDFFYLGGRGCYMMFAGSVELIAEKTSQNISVDLNAPVCKKTPEERKAIRERIFREREAAFDALARH